MGAALSYPEVDLSQKVVVVTGGNNGIGYETSKAMATMGAHTIIACRSEERATAAIDQMKREVTDKQLNVEYLPLDLASFQSTQDFVAAFKQKNLPLHILINNAGLAWVPLTKTADGYELQLQVNHLSHFLLTLELLPILLESASSTGDCRIVFVSSLTHSWVNQWEPNNLNGEQHYGRTKFYPKSKLYNVMTAYALQRRLQNVGITVSSLHPGTVSSSINRGVEDHRILLFFTNVGKLFMRSSRDGAATTINCAVNPELNSQQCFYYSDCRPVNSSLLSRNEQLQEELWKISIDFVKDYLSPDILRMYGSSQLVETENTGDEGGTTAVSNTGDEGGTTAVSNIGDEGGTTAVSNIGDEGGTTAVSNIGDEGGTTAVSNIGDEGGTTAVSNTGDEGGTTAVSNIGDEGGTTAVSNTGDEGGTTAVSNIGDEGGTTAVSNTGDEGGTTAVSNIGDEGGTTAVSNIGDEGGTTAVSSTGDEGGTTAVSNIGDEGAVSNTGDEGETTAVSNIGDEGAVPEQQQDSEKQDHPLEEQEVPPGPEEQEVPPGPKDEHLPKE